MPLLPLEGFTIGVTADRRAGEQAELLRRRGAEVVQAPTITTTYLASEGRLRRATNELVEDPPDYLVVTTAIGLRAWFEAAQSWGRNDALLEALRGARIVARGPKAAAAVQTVGLDVWRTAPDERMEGVRGLLEDVEPGAHVAVQCFGDDTALPARAVVGHAARLTTVPVYRWETPSDVEPAQALVDRLIGGTVHAVTFTSAPAVRGLFDVADRRGVSTELLASFGQGVLAACVGPACAEAARACGVEAPVAPPVGRLGLMVRALSQRLEGERREVRLGEVVVQLQGRAVLVDGDHVRLTEREAGVLAQLALRPGAVVSAGTLLRAVWRDAAAEEHVVGVTVGRLRKKLGTAGAGVVTVPRRGYRLAIGR